MKITILYPQIMKLTMSSQIDIPDATTLEETQRLVFESFWQNFPKIYNIQKHGSPQDIALKSRDVEILTDADLKESLAKAASLTALFKLHPITRAPL